jgi:hypothetical protein
MRLVTETPQSSSLVLRTMQAVKRMSAVSAVSTIFRAFSNRDVQLSIHSTSPLSSIFLNLLPSSLEQQSQLTCLGPRGATLDQKPIAALPCSSQLHSRPTFPPTRPSRCREYFQNMKTWRMPNSPVLKQEPKFFDSWWNFASKARACTARVG